jgi:hypothetical protein
MRITIVIPDKTIIVNGESCSGITTDWSWVPKNVHSVQWYDTWGKLNLTTVKTMKK